MKFTPTTIIKDKSDLMILVDSLRNISSNKTEIREVFEPLLRTSLKYGTEFMKDNSRFAALTKDQYEN